MLFPRNGQIHRRRIRNRPTPVERRRYWLMVLLLSIVGIVGHHMGVFGDVERIDRWF